MVTGRKPTRRPSFKLGYRRAISGDLEFGHICPNCAGPKTDQALRCRHCCNESQIVHGNSRRGILAGYTGARIVNYHGPGT